MIKKIKFSHHCMITLVGLHIPNLSHLLLESVKNIKALEIVVINERK